LSYYEIGYKFDSGLNLRAGKIWVPFGATPFHHYYGAVQGDPFDGLLLPNVWAEFGSSVDGRLYNGDNMHIDADAYVIRGFENEPGDVIDLTNGGSDDVFAFGGRAKVGLGAKFSAWGSALYNQWGPDKEGQVFLWGGDVQLDYGLVDVAFLRDLRLRAAFARADVQDEVLVDPADSKDCWYYRYGDYAELTYRGFGTWFPRVRYGTIIDFDDLVTNNDSHNWDLALLTRVGRHMLFLFEYQFNMEEVNEIDNDLFRFQVVFEF